MVSFILDLHSSTRSYSSRVDVDISPTTIQELPPPGGASIKAAGPATEYHSDSAESLTEIPVSSTRTGGNINALPGGLFNNNPATGGVIHGGFSRNTLPSTKKVSTKKKKHSSSSSGRKPLSPSDSQRLQNINNNYNSSMNGDVNGSGPPQDTLVSSTLGATDVSMGTRTLPEILDGKPPLRRQRSHKDVPPLDLSELSGNSDNEITGSHTGGKKRKKKSLVTKIWICSISLWNYVHTESCLGRVSWKEIVCCKEVFVPNELFDIATKEFGTHNSEWYKRVF